MAGRVIRTTPVRRRCRYWCGWDLETTCPLAQYSAPDRVTAGQSPPGETISWRPEQHAYREVEPAVIGKRSTTHSIDGFPEQTMNSRGPLLRCNACRHNQNL